MGYYTCYELEVNTEDNLATHPNSSEIIARLREENENAFYALDEEGAIQEDAKWYDSEEEMKDFSTKYPDVLFILHGDGEGSDDYWCFYFRNGKAQFAKGRIEYDEFDESKLN
jgi:hypothetical protein